MQVRGLVHVHVAFLTVSKELYDVVIFCPVVCAYHSHALVAKNAHFRYGHRFLPHIRMAPFRLPVCGNSEKLVASTMNDVPASTHKTGYHANYRFEPLFVSTERPSMNLVDSV